MGTCSACGTEIALQHCPNCGGSPALTRRKANQVLIKYSYAILAGLLGILIADHYFPLLDRNAFLIAGLCVFFAPVVFHLVSSARKRVGLDLDRLRRAYLCAGTVAVSLALLMACNGALDKSAPTPMRTSIVYKQVVRGKSGPSYTLRVRSWRSGRATEDLGVNAWTYRSVSTEKGVVVEMHRGVFGLPWYSGVYSE